jgi:hypothetical protein
MLTAILLTFMLTTGVYAALLIWACLKIVRHLRYHPHGIQALADHVLLPVLTAGGETPATAIDATPADRDVPHLYSLTPTANQHQN